MSSGKNRSSHFLLTYQYELLAYPLTLCKYRLRLVMSTHFIFYSLILGLRPEP